MPNWSDWAILIGRGPDLRRGATDLPKDPYLVYEFGIARPGETPKTTYVGHGNYRRLSIHRGSNWESSVRWRTSTELAPFAFPCLRNGYTIFYRYVGKSSKIDAEDIEHALIREWWNYPWNDRGMPWEGARSLWKRLKGRRWLKGRV